MTKVFMANFFLGKIYVNLVVIASSLLQLKAQHLQTKTPPKFLSQFMTEITAKQSRSRVSVWNVLAAFFLNFNDALDIFWVVSGCATSSIF
ncbi:hypothetical protein QUA13_30450 [Microcoleus sp. S28C3]|uniref:hypothetical protein n=1 Tax=Microcoleus sp. S28C3 TaxID=3055414 RepID=UPI002FD062D7